LKEFLIDNGTRDVGIFTIPFSRKVYKAQMKGVPISHYAPESAAGKAYEKIANHIKINTVK